MTGVFGRKRSRCDRKGHMLKRNDIAPRKGFKVARIILLDHGRGLL